MKPNRTLSLQLTAEVPQFSAVIREVDQAESAFRELAESFEPTATPTSFLANQTPFGWRHAVGLAYVCGVLLVAIRLIQSFRSLSRLLKASNDVVDSNWLGSVARWREQLGVTRNVRVQCSSSATVPFTTGVFRPVIVPQAMLQSGDAEVSDAVVLHEMAHIARRDCFWHFLLKLAQIVYWWQPLAWLSSRKIADVRERTSERTADVFRSRFESQGLDQGKWRDVTLGCSQRANGNG